MLATACPGSPVSFISPDLSADPSLKSGYRLTLAAGAGSVAGPNDCSGNGTRTAYYIKAEPVASGTSGHRAFASNLLGTIFFDPTGVAPTEAQMAPGGGGTTLQ